MRFAACHPDLLRRPAARAAAPAIPIPPTTRSTSWKRSPSSRLRTAIGIRSKLSLVRPPASGANTIRAESIPNRLPSILKL